MEKFVFLLESVGSERFSASTAEAVTTNRARFISDKAAVLSLLLAEDFPVPPGVCLTAAAFERILAPFNDDIQALLAAYDLREPDLAAYVLGRITALLSDCSLASGKLLTSSAIILTNDHPSSNLRRGAYER